MVETYISRPLITKLWQWLTSNQEIDQYHFDVRMRINILNPQLRLKEKDIVQLPNAVKLMVWSVDRGNMIKAKTTMMVVDDLRGYKPDEMYLMYPRIHGKING